MLNNYQVFDVPISYLLGYSEYPDEFCILWIGKQNKDDWTNMAKSKFYP